MGTRRFENRSDGHSKFWSVSDVELTNPCTGGDWTVVVRWGRIGTCGQIQEKRFHTHYDAAKFWRSKIDEKVGHGYKEIAIGMPLPQWAPTPNPIPTPDYRTMLVSNEPNGPKTKAEPKTSASASTGRRVIVAKDEEDNP